MRVLKNPYFLFLLFITFTIGGFFFLKKKKLRTNSLSVYIFKSLPQEQAAQVIFKNPLSQKKETIVVSFSDVLDEHYKSLVEKKNELLVLAAYEQLISSRSQPSSRVILGLPQPQRPFRNVCVQYGVVCNQNVDIQFNHQQHSFLKIDDKTFELIDLNQNTVPLLAVKTEILNYLLSKIDQTLRTKALYFLAKKNKSTVDQYIETQVISTARLDSLVRDVIFNQYKQTPVSEQKKLVEWLKTTITQEEVNQHLQKNYFQLPILVNVEKPSYSFDIRWDWTPYFGEVSRGIPQVILFADLFNDASHNLLRSFLKFKTKNPMARFGFRPFFNAQDPFQFLAAEISMCVWSKSPKTFWDYLEKSLNIDRSKIEEELYRVVNESGGDSAVIKKCLLAREVKPVVEYHQQSALFYKIINAPVLFVGQEVHVGPMSEIDFKKTLHRQSKARP